MRIEVLVCGFKSLHDLAYGIRRLLVKKQPSNPVFDGLPCAAPPEGKHRSAACVGFERRNTKVFLRGEYKCLRLLEMLPEHLKWLKSEKHDIACCDGFG